jgi:hypothetical protein
MSGHSEAPSSQSIYLILISTFIFGFLSGVILFLQNNTGGEGDNSPTKNATGFEVLAYTYGGCERLGCASYRVTEDGSYTYFEKGRENGELKFDGTLDDEVLKTLKVMFADMDFATRMETKFSGTCPVQFDGIGYRYDITYKDKRYRFDSCVQNVNEVKLFDELSAYFSQFENEYRAHKE